MFEPPPPLRSLILPAIFAMLSFGFVHLPGLIKSDELAELDALISDITFEDGKSTASGAARAVKNNLQSPREPDAHSSRAEALLMQAMAESPLLRAAAFPKIILPPIISKYGSGMSYGWHTDSPLMSNRASIRADLSMTVFLSNLDEYEGGELVIQAANGFAPFKLPKGDAILYPTTRLHCVNPVMKGERVVAVTWMQSMVRDTEKRELLFQVSALQERMAVHSEGSEEHLMLQQIGSNLIRMWADV